MNLIPVIALGVGVAAAALATSKSNILDVAKKYLGLREKRNNAGFYNKNFETAMKSVGFVPGYDYCMLFVKLVLKKAVKGSPGDKLQRLVTPSTQTSFQNFLKASKTTNYISFHKKPKPGDIAFYKWTNKSWAGHAEIVKEVEKNFFLSVSGNSPLNTAGTQGIALRRRKYGFHSEPFKLLGFIRINA